MTQPHCASLQLGLLLRQSHRRAAAALNDVLAPLDLTGRHFGVLLLIDRDGSTTQRDLIRETGSDKAGMVRTVEDLETLGYLRRTRSSKDKRVSDITLTDRGQAAFDTAKELAGRAAQDLFGAFTEAELDTLVALLTRFVNPEQPGG
ncbi:MarR family transcriptional regulator [Actinosynnema sp. NPDC051121]|nr:MarR family transcriptional regulator [Saccharothrix sp.]